MNFIRKNKEKPNKNPDKILDSPPSLTLPSFALDASVPIAAASPFPSLSPTNPSPIPDSASSSTSPPLYARFARGTFELREPELLSPSSPRQTLRHRSSNESGAGFRSGGVRDEVERLVVAKRNAVGAKSGRDSPSVRAPSIRSVMSGRDSPLPSLGEIAENSNQPRRTISQPVVALPRPPTPPPPSPPKIIFAKKLPATSPEKSLPAAPTPPAASPAVSPSPIVIPSSPQSKTLPPPSPLSSSSTLLSSPTKSPGASRTRAYSPLAAFLSIKESSNTPSNVADSNGKDQDIPSSVTTSASTPITPASTTFMSSSDVTGTSISSSPTTMNSSIKNSATSSNEPGHTGIIRPGVPKSAVRNGTVQAGPSVPEGNNSPVTGSSFVLREKGYFAMYPDRDKVKKTIENFDSPSSLNKLNLPSSEPVTSISSRPSKSSISTVEDDDPSLQAFVKNLPSSISRHTTGDSETSSIASNILASATFGETNRRIPRGARLSRIGSGFSNGNGVEDFQTNASSPILPSDKNFGSTSPAQALSRKTSGSVFEETHTSKIPTASANASTSSLSTHSREHSHNSASNTPSSSRMASKSESVRDRVRALEEEREREREKERLRRSSPWVRKDGTVGVIKPKKDEKESNGNRSVSSSTVVQQAASPISSIHDRDTTSSTQNKEDDPKVDKAGGSVLKSENTLPSLPSPQPISPSTTATASEPVTQPIIEPITQTQTQTPPERPPKEKTAPPSLIPVASNNSQPRLLGMKPLPTPGNGNLVGHEAGEIEGNSTSSIETGAPNKAGIGAYGGDASVPPVAPVPLEPVQNDEVRSVVEPPASNTRLRSGSTFDLDDDPFVRGPLVRQTTPAQATTAPTPASVPVDIVDPPTESSELQSEVSNDDVPLSGLINGREGKIIIDKSPASNGTDDIEISEKNLPLPPSGIPAVDTTKESHPPVAPLNISPKHHKHNESVATTYSNESDNDKSDEVEGEDTIDDNTPTLPPYPLERHLCHPYLFHSLLKYLSYIDVLNVLSLNHSIRRSLTDIRDLREEILERFLRTVGYSRWNWQGKEPLALSLKDLNAYLRGVSTPMHEYATIADAYLAQHAGNSLPASRILRSLAASCRSYTRLVIRLREHAEAEYAARALPHAPTSPGSPGSPMSMKHARHLSVQSATFSADSHDSSNAYSQQRSSVSSGPLQYRKFSSPLFRIHHAPLLRVFVPSANGAWLSDESVLECEKELKRAGVLPLLRPGDVVWDTAVTEEMNAGRLVWDGSYLIDLDYSYTLAGELPRYLHSLSFPPSYFHRVIQANGNPLCQIDVSPWGAEIISNVQLVQDKVITNTPQAAQHSVLRWVHRSRFQIVPDTPIPDSDGLTVDPKWVGTVVVEAEGTNEGLGNLLGRCGEQVATKAEAITGGLSNTMGKGEVGRAFRLIRSKSRPGEIWLRCVSEKEKLA